MIISFTYLKKLSYPFETGMPVYGETADIELDHYRSIKRGDTANEYYFRLKNHWGTHIDAPKHFFDSGKRIGEYGLEQLLFTNLSVIEVTLNEGQLLTWDMIEGKFAPESDLLIFRSNWSSLRDQEAYHSRNPGVHKEIGLELRKSFPKVRAVAMDWVSLSSRMNRDMGKQAHQVFLDPEGIGNPIMIIEDADFSCDLSGLQSVQIVTLDVAEIDSAPCTMIGYFK